MPYLARRWLAPPALRRTPRRTILREILRSQVPLPPTTIEGQESWMAPFEAMKKLRIGQVTITLPTFAHAIKVLDGPRLRTTPFGHQACEASNEVPFRPKSLVWRSGAGEACPRQTIRGRDRLFGLLLAGRATRTQSRLEWPPQARRRPSRGVHERQGRARLGTENFTQVKINL